MITTVSTTALPIEQLPWPSFTICNQVMINKMPEYVKVKFSLQNKTRDAVPEQLRGFTSNNSTGDISIYFCHTISPSSNSCTHQIPTMAYFTPRYLASKGKVVSELMAEEVKKEEKNFLRDSYPGLMGSPVQVRPYLDCCERPFVNITTIDAAVVGCDRYDKFQS